MKVDVVGIYGMVSMLDECIWFAQQLRSRCRLLVAGGPLPTCDPEPFLKYFDVVVRGEGEQTMQELLHAFEESTDLSHIAGIVYRSDASWPAKGKLIRTPQREFTRELDRIPFPARTCSPTKATSTTGRKNMASRSQLYEYSVAARFAVSFAAMWFLVVPTVSARLRMWLTRSSKRLPWGTSGFPSRMMSLP